MNLRALGYSLTVIVLLLCQLELRAQQAAENISSSKKTIDGRFNFIQFSSKATGNTAYKNDQQNLKRILSLGQSHGFEIASDFSKDFKKGTDANGVQHTRYNQSFKGLRVEYGVITAHSKNGYLSHISGDYFPIEERFSTAPALDEATALSFATRHMNATKYSWEDSSFQHPLLKPKPKAELVICRDFSDSAAVKKGILNMRLAYKFKLYATVPLRYDCIYVDAATGKIIHINPIIKTTGGPADTRYSGRRDIVTTYDPDMDMFLLKDSSANYNLETLNLKTAKSYFGAKQFADSDNVWSSAEFNNYQKDDAALDVHWATMKTLDYWRTVHNRNSYDNNGTKLRSYVHYDYYYANAFWDGIEMTYGDGDEIDFHPLTTIDVCGHEIGHAVCEATANLIYSDEPGAINESLSDIWGACIEQFAAPEKNTWLLADECSVTNTPLRNMADPKSQRQPDTYRGINWYNGGFDNYGVHFNSGVMNFWFYLLSVGKTGTNDNGKSYNIKAIGINKAAKIVYRAEQLYLFPAADYKDARLFTIKAAEDIFGTRSTEASTTAAAWDAVGVYDFSKIPDSLIASFDSSFGVHLNWYFDPLQTVTSFSVEKALDSSDNFIAIGTVNGNLRHYKDLAFDSGKINKYRIRVFNATTGTYSLYSSITQISLPTAPYFVMQNGTFTTCGTILTDPGGFENYPDKQNMGTFLKPLLPGHKLRLNFTSAKMKTSWDGWTWDYVLVYNGPSDSSGKFLGAVWFNQPISLIQSTAPGGDLSIYFYSDKGDNERGFEAAVTCYKPIYGPSKLTATPDSASHPVLRWMDNSDDETKFVLERSTSDSLSFIAIANIAANALVYTDVTAANNNIYYYRIKSMRDTASSAFIDTVKLVFGNPYYIIKSGTVNSCGLVLLDPGGQGNYDTAGLFTTTFIPGIAGRKIKFSLNSVSVNYYDYLAFYNGPSTNSPYLGSFTDLRSSSSFISSAPNGEMTVVFNANKYDNGGAPGFEAFLSCYKTVERPTKLTGNLVNGNNISMLWTDNADDETRIVLQRSVNAFRNFINIATLPANTTQFTDTTAPDNSLLTYRLIAFRNDDSSYYSDTLKIEKGNAPVIMNENTVTTCDKIFMDPGGVDAIPSYNYNGGSNSFVTTFKPAQAGSRIRVNFSYFHIYNNSGLQVYAGSNTNTPKIGTYYIENVPPYVDGTGPDGALTFAYQNLGYGSDSGWVAHVSCYKIVAKPSQLTAVVSAGNKVQLAWRDNADDETKYTVERSVNATNLFVPVAQLTANSTGHLYDSIPANSIIYYRVMACRDSFCSFYSDTASVRVGDYPFFMKDTTITTCDLNFLDPEGLGATDVMSKTVTCTFKPEVPGNKIRITISRIRFTGVLQVYDGPSATGSPIYNPFGYGDLPIVIEAKNSSGALTFTYSSYGPDSGWIAHVSCVPTVAKPTNLTAVANADNMITLTWIDNATNEKTYVVERSRNGRVRFVPVAELPANSKSYIDLNAPDSNLFYYRVVAKRDSISSFYSDTTFAIIGLLPLRMSDTTIVTCNRMFTGPAGEEPGPYYNTITTTLKPGVPGKKIRVEFEYLNTFSGIGVFDGDAQTGTQLGFFTKTNPPPVLEANSPGGALTFVYYYPYGSDSGWMARVSCYLPVKAATNLTANLQGSQVPLLNWTDNAADENGFIIERSIGDSLHFDSLTTVVSNVVAFSDSSAPQNLAVFYRLRAYRDAQKSLYTNIASVTTGYPVLVMSNGTFTTCDVLFYDDGGSTGRYSNSAYYSITLKPKNAGDKLKVSFNKFNTELYRDYLYVWNGPNAYTEYLGAYSGNTLPPTLQSSAPGGELTFVFNSDESIAYSGWDANIYCVSDFQNATWTGLVSTEWENPLNWNNSRTPDGQTTVLIPSKAPHFPVINSNAICNKIEVKPGASLNVNPGFRLTVVK